MKTVGETFGFGTLLTVFLPGLAFSIGILLILQSDPGWVKQQSSVLTIFKAMDEWQQTFAALAVISLLGALLAAANGVLEAYFYDKITPYRMNISADEFNRHWYEYLYRLSKESNAYISRIVTWFLFESRMAVAVAFVFFFYLVEAQDRELSHAVLFICAIGILGFLGYHHHRELAEYRRYWSEQWRSLRVSEKAMEEKAANNP